ncbi:MAG: hypothetical protein E6K06_01530 [Methanobacteriota archaeon]|nr:MAG: hypothetical protein E6K06_01530 [Euryarchaeota archaeon]
MQVRLKLFDFYRARTLSRAIGAIMLPHEVRSMIMYLVDRTRRFPVTPKDEPPMSMREILFMGRGTVALIGLMSFGLLLVNPVGLYYNILWLAPFVTSPIVLHHYCGPHTRPKSYANGGMKDLLADPRLATSVDRPLNRW